MMSSQAHASCSPLMSRYKPPNAHYLPAFPIWLASGEAIAAERDLPGFGVSWRRRALCDDGSGLHTSVGPLGSRPRGLNPVPASYPPLLAVVPQLDKLETSSHWFDNHRVEADFRCQAEPLAHHAHFCDVTETAMRSRFELARFIVAIEQVSVDL